MSDEAHSSRGPSSSERIINCPGSLLATAGMPGEDTEYSILGTAAHSLAEMSRRKDKAPASFMGYEIGVELQAQKGVRTIIVDQIMVDSVQRFVDYVNELPGDAYNEERIYYREYTPDGFGTMDDAHADTEVLYITDFKHGEGKQVYAKRNSQLLLYALGFLLTYGWMYPYIEKVVITIVQSRLDWIDSDELTVGQLFEWARTVWKPASDAAVLPGAPFKAGDWCTFCKIRRTCKTRAQTVFAALTGELDDIDEALETPVRLVNTLTNDQVARALIVKKIALAWFGDLDKHALSEIAHGRPVGDWKLVEGRSSRMWAAPPGEVASALYKEGADAEKIFTKPELLSPSAMEDVLPKKLFAPARELKTKTVPAGPLAHLILKPRGKATLARGDDRRPAMTIDASTEFDDLDSNGDF